MKLMLCDCAGSQSVDGEAIGAATPCSRVHTALCTREIAAAAEGLRAGAAIACAQEAARWEELAAEVGAPPPAWVDIRDRAGWTRKGEAPGPKQAALVAEALLPPEPAATVDVHSEGTALVIGGEAALAAAKALCETLAVTLLLDDGVDAPEDRRFDVARGRLRRLSGALGGFTVVIDGFQALIPSGRGAFSFSAPADGAESACDIVLDLSGRDAPIPASHKREGYLRADPRMPEAIGAAIRAASTLVGTFEKPLYVRLTPEICAHSRAGQIACTNCLDICPTGALTPAGEHVAVDPMVCAGCGACSALCPSGAISYDDPSPSHLLHRTQVLAETFRSAGGSVPRLLVHDAWGRDLIGLSARHYDGLPADVIPLEVSALAAWGHAESLGALAQGFAAVDVLLAPTTEREAPQREHVLTEAIAPGRMRLLEIVDPEALPDALYGRTYEAPAEPTLTLGSRRQVARLAAMQVQDAPVIDLPAGAPYGAVLVDTEACTLCLACASLCPSGTLGDNPDRPQLLFQEDACLQCGLCETVCPEDAIALQPRLDLTPEALSQRVLNDEEPALCISCQAPFGVASTIERVAAKLEAHPMLSGERAKLIRMCDDCRVKAQMNTDGPFGAGQRPRPRSTADYYSDRSDH